MRALECLCGHRLRATNDAEVSEQAHEHVNGYNSELRLAYERLGQLVTLKAFSGE